MSLFSWQGNHDLFHEEETISLISWQGNHNLYSRQRNHNLFSWQGNHKLIYFLAVFGCARDYFNMTRVSSMGVINNLHDNFKKFKWIIFIATRPFFSEDSRLTRICLLRLDDWLKLFPHTQHLWGRCFSCTCRIWIRNRSRFSNDLGNIKSWGSLYPIAGSSLPDCCNH